MAVAPDGRIGIAWYTYSYNNNDYSYNISYPILGSAGAMVVGPSSITRTAAVSGRRPDVAQMANGNIAVAWTRSASPSAIQYAILDANLSIVKGATILANMFPAGDDNVSVTRAGNRAVLTWGNTCCDYYTLSAAWRMIWQATWRPIYRLKATL